MDKDVTHTRVWSPWFMLGPMTGYGLPILICIVHVELDRYSNQIDKKRKLLYWKLYPKMLIANGI